MVEGTEDRARAFALQQGAQQTQDHMRGHLIGIRDMAEQGRFGTDQDALEALGKIVLACRCALA